MLKKIFIFYYKWILIPLILGITPVSVIASDSSMTSRTILQSASELDYPPFSLVLKDGTAHGFSVDLIKAVVKEVGFEINIAVGPWHEIKQKLIDKKINVLPFVSYSRERDQFFDFTVPYLKMHGTIFVRKGETSIHSIKDLKNKELITMRGDTAHEYAMEKNLSNKLILTDTFEEALTLLSQGKYDAVIIQQLVGLQLIKKLKIANLVDIETQMHTSLKPISIPLIGFEQKFCFAVQEGDKELLSTLNEALAIIIANGIYDHLYSKWISPNLPQPHVHVTILLKYLPYIIGLVIFLISFTGFWIMKKNKHSIQQIYEREQADDKMKEYTHHLGERVKELNCLYSISNFIEADISLEEVFQKTVNIIPLSWQYPEQTSARIVFESQEYISDVFFESQWKQHCNITVHGKTLGAVEVFYKENKTDFFENPFLKEEEDLIRAIGQRLSDTIERKEAEQNLRMVLENLEGLVKQRTIELETEVDERKQTEEKLRHSQTMLQTVFDGISDPLIMLGKDMIVEMMNNAALDYYGAGWQHAKNKPCYLGLREKNIICEGCTVPISVLAGKILSFERKGIMNPDRYERVAVYPIQAEIVEAGAIMHITDITESKRIHTQLIRTDRLSSLGQLSGGIAHEIRNPLAGIRLFVDILCDKKRFYRNDNEEELFDEIKQSIRRIDAIIKRVLNYAKPPVMSSGKVDINNIISETLKLFSTKLMDFQIKLKVSLSENITSIVGDTIGIQQVVTNLIINAIDAMSSSGILNVKTFETESSLFWNRPIVTIIIKDNGPGIKPEDRENIFNPFFTTKSTGTGLGLAISHQIIKYHGGNIYLKSEPGCGSIFTIELPITKE